MNKKETERGLYFNESPEERDKKNEKIYIVPFKKRYLKIFRGDYYYLLDRLKYDVNTIMMLLDLNRINKLADFYKDYPDGIEKVKFVEFLKKELPINYNDPMDETNLVYGLYKFFCEIDFNGDGHMQWEEFTQFVIDTVEGDKDAKVNENGEDKNAKIFDEKAMIKYKRYNLSEKLKDNLTHKNNVINGVFISKIDLIIFSEYGQKVFKIYSPKTGKSFSSIELDEILSNRNNTKKSGTKSYERFLNQRVAALSNSNNKKGGGLNSSNSKNSGFSILSMAQYQSIVAVCLSDKRILFLYFAALERIELIYEMHLPVLEKRIWYLPNHKMWLSSGCKMDKFPFFTLNELDIDIKIKNQKFEYKVNKGHSFRRSFCEKFPHRGEIMDVIEIAKPKMIVTASMDGKIRLIDVGDRDLIKVWSHHSLGVRSLDYNPLIDTAGYILSVGFEYFINVYCTDLSIDEAFKGKLEGHTAPVVSCKFLSESYMAVSVDEESNVRIWDTKSRLCLQTIEAPKKNFVISGILSLSKYNKFVVYGNKINYYDAKYREEDHAQSNDAADENYPLRVDFNKYYQQFFITTFRDVRVYTKEGTLFKIYRKLTVNEHFENEVKIKSFLFEDNYRKFYVGFSNGAIMQFNAGNGSLIKPVNENEVEKDGIQTYAYEHTKDVTSMYFYNDDDNDNENLILLSTSYDSLINAYDESNPEETQKLRSIKGGHTLRGKNLEINCLDFSKQLNLFVTGSTDSLVVVWNFELSKIEDIFYLQSHKYDKLNVNCVKFLDPYPLVVVAYSEGSVYIWGTKEQTIRGTCLLRMRNYARNFKKIDPCPVKFLNTVTCQVKDIKTEVPLLKFFDEESPFMNPHIPYTPPKPKEKEKEKDEEGKENQNNNEEERIQEEEINLDLIDDKYKKEIIDPALNPDIYGTNSESSKKYFLLLGDASGNVKMLDIMGLINKYKISIPAKAYIKSSFNILKKDDVNAETILNHNIMPMDEKRLPKYTNLYINVIKKEFKAHNDEITCISILADPLSLMTCSKDKFVKIWNINAECLGVISPFIKLNKTDIYIPRWAFKIDEEKILENEINEVVGIFEKVGARKITPGSKDDREVDHLIVLDRNSDDDASERNEEKKISGRSYNSKNEEKKEMYYDESNAYGEGYDKYFANEKQNQIEGIINGDNIPKVGMNQITYDAIKNMVNNNEKNKKKKV